MNGVHRFYLRLPHTVLSLRSYLGFCSSFLLSSSSCSLLHAPQGSPVDTSKCTRFDDSLVKTFSGSQHLHYLEKAQYPGPALSSILSAVPFVPDVFLSIQLPKYVFNLL